MDNKMSLAEVGQLQEIGGMGQIHGLGYVTDGGLIGQIGLHAITTRILVEIMSL